MQATTQAIETTKTIDAQHHLVLDGPLSIAGPTRVRVSHLLPEESDINKTEWLQAAAANPAFDFLKGTCLAPLTITTLRPASLLYHSKTHFRPQNFYIITAFHSQEDDG